MSELEDLKEALSSVRAGLWWWDIPSDTIRWSDELCDLFERDKGGAPPSLTDYVSLLPPEEREGVQSVLQNALETAAATGKPVSYTVEHRVLLEAGTVRWIEGRGRVLVDDRGKPVRVTGTAVDITERKRTEERLRQSEQVHRLFSELASDYVYVADFMNPNLFPEIVGGSFERTTGMTPEEVQAKGGWWQIIHPDDRAAMAALIPILEQGKPSVNEYRITDGAGQIRWLRDSVRPVLDPLTGKVLKLMGGVQDITDRKRLEEQLIQAQKLEAIARLSGGIAHDFNNLLSVIMGAAGLLQSEVATASESQSCDAILEAASRGAELTRGLLVFARRDAGSPQLVDLVSVVREAIPMLSRAVGSSVSVSLEEEAAPVQVRIDRGQAQLLLLNLAVNARDAMPAGGRLRIQVTPSADGDDLPGELAPGRHARLSIHDEGEGIAPEIMPRLFEPFFTTKAHGKGTGLGLAASHGIVQHAGGAIQVQSVLGQGTTFTIYLPLVTVQASAAQVSRARVSPGGTERILVVDDEKSLQRILGRMLSDRGYGVLLAGSAEEALTALEVEPVDLLISDIVLPGMHGTELAREARQRWPAMKILLISGYPGTTSIPDGVPLLSKPFAGERLASRVRALLDGIG